MQSKKISNDQELIQSNPKFKAFLDEKHTGIEITMKTSIFLIQEKCTEKYKVFSN